MPKSEPVLAFALLLTYVSNLATDGHLTPALTTAIVVVLGVALVVAMSGSRHPPPEIGPSPDDPKP